MDEDEARRRFGSARVARLGTVRPDGAPHLVPIVFAVDGETVFSVVDDKPKRSTRLQRLANVRHDPHVSLLVDHYQEDWDGLWWVRGDGLAAVLEAGPERDRANELLTGKYPTYRRRPPTGPALVTRVTVWRWWSAG